MVLSQGYPLPTIPILITSTFPFFSYSITLLLHLPFPPLYPPPVAPSTHPEFSESTGFKSFRLTTYKTASKTYASGGPHPSDVELYVTYSTGQPAPKSGQTYLLCPYTYYYFYLINNSSCSTSGYEWTLPPSISKVWQYNNMICVHTGYNPGGNVQVKANTCCGCANKLRILSAYVGTYYDCGGYYFSMSPNPADDYVEIKAEKDQHESTERLVYEEYEVRIYNTMKVLMYQTKTKELQFRIDTRQFKSGVYFVYFIVGDDTEVLQLVVGH